MTGSGPNTVNLSQMTTWQQVLLFLHIFGSSICVPIWTVVARKHAFEQRFQNIVRAGRTRRANQLEGPAVRRGFDSSCRFGRPRLQPHRKAVWFHKGGVFRNEEGCSRYPRQYRCSRPCHPR
ncbi:uncharacterized protein B0H64DRAFT_408199 [Chaetomium fimeti]|uniref:Uncharacterized protein n=1 Tax=Chaetomium fimeti TaxID=1854472 RepID=A0AAE0H8H8_9PEZI|nr:hypothetical protein B0H64DRAFT_408199 [Chaetomium fimeti]